MKALYIRTTIELHAEIKAIAAYQHKKLEQWITEALIEKLNRDKSVLKEK